MLAASVVGVRVPLWAPTYPHLVRVFCIEPVPRISCFEKANSYTVAEHLLNTHFAILSSRTEEIMSLRSLFIDFNAYFASVEQQEQPNLRGRPIAVVPVLSKNACCIAASY